MHLFLTVRTADGTITQVPLELDENRFAASPGAVYQLTKETSGQIDAGNIQVTRTGQDLFIKGLSNTGIVVIEDFFLSCRFGPSCELRLESLGAERSEAITPLTNALAAIPDGFLLWTPQTESVAADIAPISTPGPAPLSPVIITGVGVGLLAAIAMSPNGGNPVGSDPVVSDPPVAAPPPTTEPPPAPAPVPTPNASVDNILDNENPTTGIVLQGGLTNDPSPVINGSIDLPLADGQSVQLMRDDLLLGLTAVNGEQWAFVDNLSADGEYIYQAMVTDADGSTLSGSDPFTLLLDTQAPVRPQLDRVEGNNVISARELADGVQLSGSSEPDALITVLWGEESISGLAGNSGDWALTFDTPPVGTGASTIQVAATDEAGNMSAVRTRTVLVTAPLGSEDSNLASGVVETSIDTGAALSYAGLQWPDSSIVALW